MPGKFGESSETLKENSLYLRNLSHEEFEEV